MTNQDGFRGYLWKWTNYFGGWQQRWFVLKDGSLTYYRDVNTTDTGCRGSYKLEACNITVHPVDSLRFDLTTSSQRIYLKTNTKPSRQRWIIQLGSTKANISEEMPEPTSDHASLSSFHEHRSELRTVRLLLSEQITELRGACQAGDIDSDRLKQSQAMIEELCEEFLKTLDSCTSNILEESRDPLSRSTSHGENTPTLSLGSYVPPSRQHSGGSTPSGAADTPSGTADTPSGTADTPSGAADAPCNETAGVKRVEKLPITYFSNIADRMEDVTLTPDAIPTVAFLDACSAIPKLLITIGGKAVITLSLDIGNNINKIQTKQKLNPSKSDTLQAMVHYEIGTKTTHAKHSATVALLWLHREITFVQQFLVAISSSPGVSDMSSLFMECYDKTLRAHHNVMSRSMYTVASKAIPYREDMLRALGHDGMLNTDTAVLTDLQTYGAAIGTVSKYIEMFYINNKLLA